MSRYDIDNYMPLLQEYARECPTGYILELGIGQADGSTKSFIDGLEERGGSDRLMISVDHQVDFEVNTPTVDYWRFVLASTIEPTTIKMVAAISIRPPDILFIDTDHTYEQMTLELLLWGQVAGPNTVWLFHDTYMFGGYNPMGDAIKEYAAATGWTYEDVSTDPHGLGRMRR